MRPSPQFVVYLVGIVAFGFFYAQIKTALSSGGVFLLFAIAYVLILRLLGNLVARVLGEKEAK